MTEKFYLTTAIPYVNSRPHIGFAHEIISADVIARYNRLIGKEVFFLTGTDEHSANVERKALELGKTPQEFCDEMMILFKNLCGLLNISNTDFVRTTEQRHHKAVQEIFRRAGTTGDIYKNKYKGWYCLSCESFLLDKELIDGMCPIHKSKPEWLEEDNYFFRLSKYQDTIRKHIENNHDFISPESRKNEMLGILERGLRDISVSRSSFNWGIPLPQDPSQVIYIWIEALINYVTGIGFPDNNELFNKYWPADLHIIGKDITRFHCIVWPALLMSAGLQLPKRIFGHGFITVSGEKMSKTLGNIVEPQALVEKYGVDSLRFFLSKEVVFGSDYDFNEETFITKLNSDLANDLGNLVGRSISMIAKYRNCIIPTKRESTLRHIIEDSKNRYISAMNELAINEGLNAVWEIVRSANRYIDETKPWAIAKLPEKEAELDIVLFSLADALRSIATLLSPIMPSKTTEIEKRLGLPAGIINKIENLNNIEILANQRVELSSPLFPRIESAK